MEFGPYQLQIFVSLVLIVGAACVALICDYLKSNNEQLRELAVELRARCEEEQRRSSARITREKISGVSRHAPRREAPPMPRSPAASRAKAAAQRERVRAIAPPAESIAVPLTRKVMAEIVTNPAFNTGGEKKKDWNSLLAVSPARPRRIETLVIRREDAPGAKAPVPAGFHDRASLDRLIRARQSVSGLVVAIGAECEEPVPDAVITLIGSLIETGEFAVEYEQGEFVLVCAGERGAAAQRRLRRIAQQLWDFQLRSLGTVSILFAWGGLEVNNKPLDQAIASATERMYETRSARAALRTEPLRLRAAV